LWDDGKVGDANGSGVVHLDGHAWLQLTHLDGSLTEGDHFLCCGVESIEFGFNGRRHDILHYLGDGENRTVVLGEEAVFGDKDVGTGLTAATVQLPTSPPPPRQAPPALSCPWK
jgi:hypothetical protein